MATGEPAFPQKNLAHLIEAIQFQEPRPPAEMNPHVPVAIERIISKAMQKEPAARYQSAFELADALEALMPRGTGTGAPTPAAVPALS
jgi:eukaryotic-like serine/threonine-protein kinase